MVGTQIPGLSTITDAAKELSKGPLGIIAFFILLVYLIAALVILIADLEPISELIIVLFVSLFPALVFVGFCWLVAFHHHKLYPPSEIESSPRFVDMVLGMAGPVEDNAVTLGPDQEALIQKIGVSKDATPLASFVLRFNDPQMRGFRGILRDWAHDTQNRGRLQDFSNPRELFSVIQVLNFFESLGHATREGSIALDESIEYFGSTVWRYWRRAESLVSDLRIQRNVPTYFEEFEWLAQISHTTPEKEQSVDGEG